MKEYSVEEIKETRDSEVLKEVLRRGKKKEVIWAAAQNSNCPPELLTEVLRRGRIDVFSYYVIQNPNCSSEALVKVLKRGKIIYFHI